MDLSICVTVKNRSRVQVEDRELQLFPNCVCSIVEAVGSRMSCELIVTDFGSDDWPLQEWLPQAAHPIPVKIIHVDGPFSRGQGLNIAAEAAESEFLLFADTDLLLGTEVFTAGIKNLKENKACFPVLFYYNDLSHTDGWWNYYSLGNCFVTKKMFYDAGRWPEYKTWGKEDDHFFERVSQLTEVVRETVGGFRHQWHPDDLIWKNRYAEKADEIAHEIREVIIAKEEIVSVIPEGASFIIIDEARFGGSDCVAGRREFQFPEVNGEYGGLPGNSEEAIQEFKRLYSKGASYLVFAWMAFWWLDHYSDFGQYLKTRFHRILENDRLIVFDLRLINGDVV